MKAIYEVEYKEKWLGLDEWVETSIRVVGNGSAERIIEKVKKHALAQTYKDSETGKTQRCVGFELDGIKKIAEAQL